MNLALLVLIPLLGALAPPLLARRWRLYPAWAAGVVTAAALAVLLALAPHAFRGGLVQQVWHWLPDRGLSVAFRLDGLSLLFALLILGIGLLVILYARYYLSESDPLGRFYSQLLLFMGAMLGVVLSENVLLLVVFWELTSLSSFLLIGYAHRHAEARQGARMALIVTGGGGLALLAGLLLLGHVAGSFDLSVILRSGERIQSHPLFTPLLVLILIGAFTKSAQFPFHAWLPQAMVAPTPVSAYLHSATMVKAGVFLLARLHPALSGTDSWFFLVSGVGLVTLLFGAYTALFQHDLKGLLAYSTISHLGLITLLFGFGTPLGAVAGVFHIINHAIFKASLFMAAGIIDHESGSRDMRRLNGLFHYMPHTAVLAMVAAASMAGVPLLNGFLSKEMFFAEALHENWLGPWNWTEPLAAGLYGVFSVAYSVRFIHDVFFNGEPVNLPRTPHEPQRWMKIPVEILVALVLLVGILPAWTVGPLLAVAAGSLLPQGLPVYHLEIWHGYTPAFILSLVAMGGGLALYTQRAWLFALHDRVFPRVDAAAVFERLLSALIAAAGAVNRRLENGSLQRYLALLFASTLLAGFAVAWSGDWGRSAARAILAADGASASAAAALIVASLATVILHRRRLVAVVLLGVVGLVVALAFVRFSGPDLALTQLAVEIVTVVLMLLAVYFLPEHVGRESTTLRRARDGALALLGGAGAAALTWTVLRSPQQSISDYYLQNSLPRAGGRNVVNVILVDFRGFDTLGEISVLAIAALGIYAMLRGLHLAAPQTDRSGRAWARDPHPVVLAMTARLLLPFALLFSWFLLLRGHHEPGGGFVAGLVTSIALILLYVAAGTRWTQERLGLSYPLVIALGVGLAAGTGAASLICGEPFLTSGHTHLHLPVLGDVELASALAFDIGVYVTVVGALMLILAELGMLAHHESEATPPGQATERTWKS